MLGTKTVILVVEQLGQMLINGTEGTLGGGNGAHQI